MRRKKLVAVATATLIGAAVALPLTAAEVGAAPAAAPSTSDRDQATSGSDNLTMPWQEKYDAVRKAALEQRLRRGGSGDVERLGRGSYGRVAQSGTDKIFVVLAEFGNTEHSKYPDGESDALLVDGPAHNEIPRPDRKTDNSTLWQSNYDRAHYRNIYFNRMRTFYEQQSSGHYSIDGAVSEWVKVPYNEARYGRNFCGDNVCNNTWFLIRDGLAQWTQDKLDSGWTMARIQRYLRTFDHQDRYDYDEDGDFNEPDGYIDHFQIVHAGGDEADGDPTFGEDAIWSHRWYAGVEPFGTGPDNGPAYGGVDVGEGGVSDPSGSAVEIPDNPTGVWVGDYTIQPENGGLSVFAHEFGHDLGLPDLYDTSGNSGGAENSVGFWSLMSQSRGTARSDKGIGDQPMPFGAWEKFQLGWLDYDVARAGRTSTHRLRPGQATKGNAANGLVVLLPDKQVTSNVGAPCATCGERYFNSGSGDDLNNTMTITVADGGPLTAKVHYDIEPGWDYAFLEASADGGATWTALPTSESYAGIDEGGTNPDGTGISGSTDGAWVDLTADVPAGTDTLRWRYLTDTAVAFPGFQVDNITLAGELIGTAETDDEGWSFNGFRTTNGTEEQSFLNAYFVDNRQYVGRDRLLRNLYNFIGSPSRPNKVEFLRNDPGALISYWDTSVLDNNVGDHPGSGEILPVDAHPNFTHTPDGALARPRTLTADSAFSMRRSPTKNLHFRGQKFMVRSQSAVPLFDDTLDWWFDGDEHGTGVHAGHYQPGWYSVDVPKTGTTIRVVKVNKRGVMKVQVGTSS